MKRSGQKASNSFWIVPYFIDDGLLNSDYAIVEEQNFMDWLRSFIKWISRHRILSSLFALVFVALIVVARVITTRTEGVLSEVLERGSIVEAVYGIGTVTAQRSYQLRPGVISTLQEVYVKEGDSVAKGSPLAKVDTLVYRAPFNGTVVYLPFKIGENIFPQVPMLSMTDLSDRYLVVSLEQQGALRVKRGQKVKMSFDTMRDKNYDGVVQAVYSYNGSFLARVDVSELPAKILPDMTADVAIEIDRHENALLAPVAAFEQGIVWVKRGHQIPHKVEVKAGIVDNEKMEIISGDVQAGDRLLIHKKAGS